MEGLIQSDSRQSLVDHTRALDRVLLWGYYVVPNWYLDNWRIAYWNRFGHPEKVPPLYSWGLKTWWQAREKAEPTKTAAKAAAEAPADGAVAQGANSACWPTSCGACC